MKLLSRKDITKFLKRSRLLKKRLRRFNASPFFQIDSVDFSRFIKKLGKYAQCEVGLLAGHTFEFDRIIIKIFSTGEEFEINAPAEVEEKIIKYLISLKVDCLIDLHTHLVEYSPATKVPAPNKLFGVAYLPKDLIPSRADVEAWNITKEFLKKFSSKPAFYVGIIAGEKFTLTKLS